MAHNLGIDMGMVYSFIAHIKNVKATKTGQIKSYELESVSLNERGKDCNDTLIVKAKNGKKYYGIGAREKLSEEEITVYKGFKVLLSEKNENKLLHRGYSEDFTPKDAIREYVTYLLNQYSSIHLKDGEKIDNLVVGVPEIWFSDSSTADCVTTLEEIIIESGYVNNVTLISEPALACAYFAYNYKKNEGKDFKGKVLVIDYGGGTLDIALCNIDNNGINQEVTVEKKCGAGANEKEDGFILGKAGLAFLEGTVKMALVESGVSEADMLNNNDFYSAVNEFEDALINDEGEIEDVISMYGGIENAVNITDTYKTINFADAKSGKFKHKITYGMMCKAYSEIIMPVLDDRLNKIIEYMDSKNINYKETNKDDFKIALVGGFCKFYLTQNQIKQKFKYSGKDDLKFAGVIPNPRDREKAIAYGAALIANEVISTKLLSPYTLSIVPSITEKIDGKELERAKENEQYDTIIAGMEIEYDKVVFAKDKEGREFFAGDHIPFVKIKYDSGFEKCGNPAMKLSIPQGRLLKLGFSIDRSAIISLHVLDFGSLVNPCFDKEPVETVIKLKNIDSLLGGFYTVDGGNVK